MQNVSSFTKTDQVSIITNRQYYDLDLITEIYLFTATLLSLFYMIIFLYTTPIMLIDVNACQTIIS